MEYNSSNTALGGRDGGVIDDGEENGNSGDGGSDKFPLLDRLLEKLPEVLERFVLPELDPTDLAMLARAGKGWRATVVSSNLPCAGKTAGSRLKLDAFCRSFQRLAWAKANGCPWNEKVCSNAARGGHVDVLRWARENECPWDEWTCAYAARGGHLNVLEWARDHDCPWNPSTCAYAARGGHIHVLQWAREHDCPWDPFTCLSATEGGHLDVLRWARGHDCPWHRNTCWYAARYAPLAVLRWAMYHGAPVKLKELNSYEHLLRGEPHAMDHKRRC
jgi:hypothetical protein